MKKLYLIGGTMGVGKTTVCQALKKQVDSAVFLDGDWCWDADPFVVTDETKAMVLDNICHLLNNFIACSVYHNIIFCWVMHEQQIIDSLVSRLDTTPCELKLVSLYCSPEHLQARLGKDIAAGLRQAEVLERSLARLAQYRQLHTQQIDTSQMTPQAVANYLAQL